MALVQYIGPFLGVSAAESLFHPYLGLPPAGAVTVAFPASDSSRREEVRKFQSAPPLLPSLFQRIRRTVPTFEPDGGMTFADYLATYNEAIFDRWVARVASGARDDSLVRLDRPVSNEERIEAQMALFALEKEDYERRNPPEKMTDEQRREHDYWQCGCDRRIRERGGPAYSHFEINPFCDLRSQPWNRKIYVNPRLSAVPDLVRGLRREAVAEGLPIFDSKTYRLALRFGVDHSVIGQRHNFFCLYLWEDEALPALLRIIQRLERGLEAMGHRAPVLLAQPEGQYLRGAHALGGKVLLGLDLREEHSFDNWTMVLQHKGQDAAKRIREDNPNASPEEVREAVRAAMIAALKWYRGEDIGPDKFLSFP